MIILHRRHRWTVLSSRRRTRQTGRMSTDQSRYRGYRYPPEIIGHAVWLYHRFCLSFRDVEDLLAERGIIVSYETIRQWCGKFGPLYARAETRRQGTLGDTWYLDEVFITIQGRRQYLWRTVDRDWDTLDILVQRRRDRRAAERFFRKLLKGEGVAPRWMVTDKLKSYSAARRRTMASVVQVTEQYANNRAEVSHEPTRQREYQMRRFQSPGPAQRFRAVHAVVGNLFRLGRHMIRAVHCRTFRARAFDPWQEVTCACWGPQAQGKPRNCPAGTYLTVRSRGPGTPRARGGAPEGILSREPANQGSDVLRDSGAPTATRAGYPGPVEAKSLPVPSGQCVGLEEGQGLETARPEAIGQT